MERVSNKDRKEAHVVFKGTDGAYIKVPEFDRLGYPHQGAAINQERFEAGHTYYLSAEMAETLEEILDRYEEETFRLLMSKVNKRALQQLQRSGNSTAFVEDND